MHLLRLSSVFHVYVCLDRCDVAIPPEEATPSPTRMRAVSEGDASRLPVVAPEPTLDAAEPTGDVGREHDAAGGSDSPMASSERTDPADDCSPSPRLSVNPDDPQPGDESGRTTPADSWDYPCGFNPAVGRTLKLEYWDRTRECKERKWNHLVRPSLS